jgi:hypothetical protein
MEVIAIALRTIGSATRFFLTRHSARSWVGPYVVRTTEVRPGAYETTVTWGEGGLQVEQFGSGLSFELEGAEEVHDELCERVEREIGLVRLPAPHPPAA